MNPLLTIKLIDLALMGGDYAARALASRNKIEAWAREGGPTPEQIAELDAETDALIAQLAAERNAPPPRPDA